MYSFKNVFSKNPIQISGAFQLVLNFFIIAGIIHWDAKTVAGANGALFALLGLFVVSTTTNTAKLNELMSTPDDSMNVVDIPKVDLTGPSETNFEIPEGS